MMARPLRRPTAAVLAVLAALYLAVLTACQTEGQAPEVSDEEAAQVALTASLPYGVDVSGQDVAISSVQEDATLTDLLTDKRFAVLNTFQAVAREPDLPGADCSGDQCRQVEIYNYTDATTIVATVDMEAGQVLDLHVLPEASPALSDDLAAKVQDLIAADPQVAETLGGRAYEVGMGPVATRQDEGPCATHWCVLVSLVPEGEQPKDGIVDRILVFVDLDEEKVVDVFWRSTLRQEADQ